MGSCETRGENQVLRFEELAQFRGAPAVFVSPHPDDCAFSLGGTFLSNQLQVDLTILNVFSDSHFAPRSSNIASTQVRALRWEEEKAFANSIGATLVDLGFMDCGLRGYSEEDENSGSISQDPITFEVSEALRDTILKLNPHIIFSPLGVGNHIDHLIVREAVMRLPCNDRIILFYEDLPYAAHVPLYAIRELARGAGAERLIASDIEHVLVDKCRKLGFYTSQVCSSDYLDIETHASRRTGISSSEFLWGSL